MSKTYKDSKRNADKLREINKARQDRFEERKYILDLLEENPRIKYAYNEYKYADIY